MNDPEVMSKLGRKFQEALRDPELQVCASQGFMCVVGAGVGGCAGGRMAWEYASGMQCCVCGVRA